MILQRSIEIEITNACNLNCVHCYLPQAADRVFMNDTELYRKMLKDFADQGFLMLTITGGETFLNPKLFEFLKIARELRYLISLKTNGTMIDEDSAKKLAEMKLRPVDISIYSAIPEEHDSITGVDGSFERSINAARLLQKAGAKVALITVVIYRLKGWKKVHDLSQKLGVEFSMAPGVFSSLDMRPDVENLKNSTDDFVDFYKYCDSIGEKYPLPYEAQSVFSGCGGGKSIVYVDSSFNVRPCAAYPEITGKYEEGKVDDILKNSTKNMKDRFEKMECHDCELVRYCSPCPARLKEVNGVFVCDSNSKAFALAKKKIYSNSP